MRKKETAIAQKEEFQNNKVQVEVLQKQINPVVQKAEELVIKTAEDMTEAVETLSKLNKFNDHITQEKEKITIPLNQALKAERGRWKPLETLYTDAIEVLRQKMTKYQTESVAKATAKQEKIAEAVSGGTISVDKAITKLGDIDVADKKVVADTGSVNFIEVKKFEVVSMAELPLQFHLPDETKIRQAMKEGFELKGVRYFTEQQVRNIR